jgi:hypothetical protein
MLLDNGKKESLLGARIARRMLQKHKQSPLAEILLLQKRRRTQRGQSLLVSPIIKKLETIP